ncbi:Gldg family protein [Mucilaginibacter sp.]|uniref:Gldg family protein n=1 Tax=Mucilaginibacter sp. TaxID=1882438 RepID=UPI002847CC15|nr:Gldg family protein [Mucilaginibacter sp.]MDR3697037.1 Gldg family protein [Mucilaginibacter sp.]
MKIILKIAKNELRNLFYSPVAWFLAIALLVQCAIFYTSIVHQVAGWQDIHLANNPRFKDFGADTTFTKSFFIAGDSIFSSVLQNLTLFIPLLTMGLIGREVNNGTIKLLYSSPIKLRAIVLGKYLAIVIYNLLMVAIVGIFIVLGAFNIRSADIALLLSAELAFFLMICAYGAIGLFMSSLTTYQIVSAMGTFLFLFLFGRIGALWQKYDFIRDLTWFLSLSGRTARMVFGLITTKDVFYFLLIIFMFLSFTLFKLKGEKESKPWSAKALRYITVIVVSLLLGYITSRPALVGYWDTTAHKENTIDPRIQNMLKQMGNEPLEVTLYTNLLGEVPAPGLPEGRNPYLAALWEPYLRFKPDITFKYVYYYDYDGTLDNNSLYKTYPNKTEKEVAGIMADLMGTDVSMFMGPDEIHKIINPAAERGRLFMSVKYKGRVVHLRTFNDSQFWPNQSEVAAGLKQLIKGDNPKVYCLTGNLERSIYKTGEREYEFLTTAQRLRDALVNNGFDLDTLSLENHDIPADISELVIADPKTELSPKTLAKVQQYIDQGGNLLIIGEPGKQAMLNPVLKPLGVQLRSGTLVELSKNETPDKIRPYATDDAFDLGDIRGLHQLKQERKEKNFDDTLSLIMPGAAAIAYAANGPFKVTPLYTTVKQRDWLKAGRLVIDSVPPVFSPQEGDIKDSTFATMVQLTRPVNNKQQRIIVCGDADFLSDLRYDSFQAVLYSWLDYGKYPVYINDPYYHDNKLNITEPTAAFERIFFVWVLPGALVLLAAILLIRRKRK